MSTLLSSSMEMKQAKSWITLRNMEHMFMLEGS